MVWIRDFVSNWAGGEEMGCRWSVVGDGSLEGLEWMSACCDGVRRAILKTSRRSCCKERGIVVERSIGLESSSWSALRSGCFCWRVRCGLGFAGAFLRSPWRGGGIASNVL